MRALKRTLDARDRRTPLARWLVVATLLAGCGRTEQNCDDCGAAQGGITQAGESGRGGSGGISFGGAAGAPRGGQGVTAPNWTSCDVGIPATPLVRYSSTDLEWTLDDLIGPGPALTRTGERFDQSQWRTTDPIWVQSLIDSLEARVRAMPLDEASWLDCDDINTSSPCASARIMELGLRIHRRPLLPFQADGYFKQFQALAATSRIEAARAVVTSMLLSPVFVFRIELGEAPAIPLTLPPPPSSPPQIPFPTPLLPSGTPLNDYEIAARLSHYILRQAPDQQLLTVAASGALRSAVGRVAEVDRMLASEPSKRARVLQHLEWLALDDSSTEPRDVALRQQMSAFIGDVLVNRNGSFRELLTSPRQPLNLELAQYYGLQVDVGAELELVDLDPQLYAGVLGQGLWLTRVSTPTTRGQAVLERLLCSPIPDHPPTLPLGDFTGNTPRERISKATSGSPVCAACHQQTDPIGFALEAFDSDGRLTGFDTTGSITLTGQSSDVPLSGPVALGAAIATSRDGANCAAERSVEFLLDRKSEDPNEGALFSCLLNAFSPGELDLNQLARLVAASSASAGVQQVSTLSLAASQQAEPLSHAAEECETMCAGASEPERSTLGAYCQALRVILAERMATP